MPGMGRARTSPRPWLGTTERACAGDRAHAARTSGWALRLPTRRLSFQRGVECRPPCEGWLPFVRGYLSWLDQAEQLAHGEGRAGTHASPAGASMAAIRGETIIVWAETTTTHQTVCVSACCRSHQGRSHAILPRMPTPGSHDGNRTAFVGERGDPTPGHTPLTCGSPPTEEVIHSVWSGLCAEKNNGRKTVCVLAWTRQLLTSISTGQELDPECPRQDSNLRTRLRRPLLYPLSYGGLSAVVAATGRTLPASGGWVCTGFLCGVAHGSGVRPRVVESSLARGRSG